MQKTESNDSHTLKIIIKYISFSILYIGFAIIGMWLTSRPPSSLSVLWLPAGIGLVSILVFGKKGLILVYLSSSIANGGYGFFSATEDRWAALYSGLLGAVVDLIQTSICYFLYKTYRISFLTIKDFFLFFLRFCLLPPILTVWSLPLIWHYIGKVPMSDSIPIYAVKVIQIVSADMLGIFLVTPLFFSLRRYHSLEILSLSFRIGISLLLPVLLALYVHIPLISLIVPVILVYVLRYRFAGSTLSLTYTTGYLFLYLGISGSNLTNSDWFSFFNISFLILCIGFVPHYIAITLEQLRTVRKTLELKVKERTKELISANQKLEMMANTDLVTGLLTRRAFLNRFKYESDRFLRTGRVFSIAILDLDHFKQINDSHGHSVGDEVLLAFSQIMISHLRITDIACRWGGEEFIILFPDTTIKEASISLNRILTFTETSEDLSSNVSIRLTVSIGVTDSIVSNLDSIISNADKAMYAAKSSGRNKICLSHG